MLEVDYSIRGMKVKNVYLANEPYDVVGYDRVSFPYLRKRVDKSGFERFEDKTIVIDLNQGTEKLWSNISTKCRSDIRKAEGKGINVVINGNCKDFMTLLDQFRTANNLSPFPEPQAFLDMIRHPLPEALTLFTADQGDEMVGGVLFIKDQQEMMGILAASKRLDVEGETKNTIAMANRLLWWEATKYGSEKGLQILDMGGFFEGTDQGRSDPKLLGVSEFKRRFGGSIVPRYHYTKAYTIKMRLARQIQKVESRLGINR